KVALSGLAGIFTPLLATCVALALHFEGQGAVAVDYGSLWAAAFASPRFWLVAIVFFTVSCKPSRVVEFPHLLHRHTWCSTQRRLSRTQPSTRYFPSSRLRLYGGSGGFCLLTKFHDESAPHRLARTFDFARWLKYPLLDTGGLNEGFSYCYPAGPVWHGSLRSRQSGDATELSNERSRPAG